jgi:hypothetical protein
MKWGAVVEKEIIADGFQGPVALSVGELPVTGQLFLWRTLKDGL